MSKSPKTPRSVIAAVKDDTQFRAVELRIQDDEAELLWAKSLPSDNHTWSDFAVECGVAPDALGKSKSPRKDAISVVGLDSTAVAFYRITAPAVSEEETAAIVRMQVESLLPLPPEQIEVAWRTIPSNDGKMDVTMAAARCDHLKRFVDSVRDWRPEHILLSCEATAQAWQSLFTDRERQAAVVSIGQRHTQVCLIQAGRVAHAAVLDVGLSDLICADEAMDASGSAEATERFALDVRTTLDSFGWDVPTLWPILVLSDGREEIDRVVASLNAAGLHVKTSLPGAGDLKVPADFGLGDVYQYRTPLGLALLAMSEPSDGLDLFQGILQGQAEASAKRSRYSIILAAAVAVFMLVALIATSYAVDKSRDRHYQDLLGRTDVELARQRQNLLKVVAQNRPNLLQLLTDINAGQNPGIVLDSLHFKKGQPVSITGQAGNQEQLWAFQKNLAGQKGIEDAEPSSVSQDSKTKKIRFTITFHYKSYTKKSAVL